MDARTTAALQTATALAGLGLAATAMACTSPAFQAYRTQKAIVDEVREA